MNSLDLLWVHQHVFYSCEDLAISGHTISVCKTWCIEDQNWWIPTFFTLNKIARHFCCNALGAVSTCLIYNRVAESVISMNSKAVGN